MESKTYIKEARLNQQEAKIMKKALMIARNYYQKKAYVADFKPTAGDVFELSQIELWLKELE